MVESSSPLKKVSYQNPEEWPIAEKPSRFSHQQKAMLTCAQHHRKERNDERALATQDEEGLIAVRQKLLKAFALSFRAAVGDHVGEVVGEHKRAALSSDFPFELEIAENMPEVCGSKQRS